MKISQMKDTYEALDQLSTVELISRHRELCVLVDGYEPSMVPSLFLSALSRLANVLYRRGITSTEDA